MRGGALTCKRRRAGGRADAASWLSPAQYGWDLSERLPTQPLDSSAEPSSFHSRYYSSAVLVAAERPSPGPGPRQRQQQELQTSWRGGGEEDEDGQRRRRAPGSP